MTDSQALPPHPEARYGSIDNDYVRELAFTEPANDGPVWMVNLMKYREVADYTDGRESTITGQAADDLYAPLASLAAVGAEIVLFASVEMQLIGDAPKWDRVAVVKYPTRRSFMEMQQRPDFIASHVHKDAGMEHTIIIGTQPMSFPTFPDDIPDWSSVAHPPTADDPSILIMHVLRFNEGGAEGDMVAYQAAAGAVAVPHGVRIAGWFSAEGTIVGDGREWDQVRYNAFPSRAAFMAVATDPQRLAAQADHRETAIADTYTLMLRPTINRIAESISNGS